MMNPMMNHMNGMMPPMIPNFGLGPNDNMNMYNSMLGIFNNNAFQNNNNRPFTGYMPGPRDMALSPFIFEDRNRNSMIMRNPMMNPMNNPMMNMQMMMMNLNLFMNNMNNNVININIPDDIMSLDRKDIKRDENLDVKMDVDKLLKENRKLDNKNKDIQYILNYIPFTILKEKPKKKGDEPNCLICLSDFEVDEKVSALPCFHCYHTKCLDEWIIRNAKCPVCKYEITLKNLIGEDIIKEHKKKIEEAQKEAERKEAERKEAERKEAERKEKERKEKERIERQLKEKERKEKERKEKERKEKEVKNFLNKLNKGKNKKK